MKIKEMTHPSFKKDTIDIVDKVLYNIKFIFAYAPLLLIIFIELKQYLGV